MDRADAEMHVLSGANAGKVLRFRDAVTIGSARDCNLVLDDPGISPLHATIEPRGTDYTLIARAPTHVAKPRAGSQAVLEADLATHSLLDFGPTTVMFTISASLAETIGISSSSSGGVR